MKERNEDIMALSASGTHSFNNCKTDKSTTVDWIHLDVKYDIQPVTGTTSYKVTLNLKLWNTYSMTWTGGSYLTVKINDKYAANKVEVEVPLTKSNDSAYLGPYTYTVDLGVGNDKPVKVYTYLDFTRTMCSICKKSGTGPGYVNIHSGSGVGAGHFIGIGGNFTDTVDVQPTHTHSAPSGGSFKAIDVTQTSMKITWSSSDFNWGCTSGSYSKWWVMYKTASGSYPRSWTEVNLADDYSMTSLTPNTNYNIKIGVANSHYGKSGLWTQLSAITVRTLCATPNVSIANANKYNNQNGVSASTTSIKVLASNSAPNTGDITYKYRIKKSTDTDYGDYQTSDTFSSLTPGTTYVVEVLGTNPDNYTDTAEITIRTKYAQSNFTTDIVTTDIGLEHINFTATVKYGSTNAILSGTWSIGSVLNDQTLNISSATGTGKTGYVLAASTLYQITVVAKLTSTYDDIICTFSESFTTDAKSSFADTLGNFNFCYPTEVAANYKITNPSGNAVRCSLVVGGSIILTRDKYSNWDNSVDLQLTDAEWDSIYKKLGTNNSVPYTFTVGTYSNKNKNYTTYMTDSTGTITLTGKMKTAHVGLEDGSVKRAQARVGVNNQVRLAVVWVGDKDGKPMRMI